MSETTKRTSHLTPFYLPSPDMADNAEWDLWERLHRDVPPRPSTLPAEGSAERKTTNSPAEIGTGCTGLEWVLSAAIIFGTVATLAVMAVELCFIALAGGWPWVVAILFFAGVMT